MIKFARPCYMGNFRIALTLLDSDVALTKGIEIKRFSGNSVVFKKSCVKTTEEKEMQCHILSISSRGRTQNCRENHGVQRKIFLFRGLKILKQHVQAL